MQIKHESQLQQHCNTIATCSSAVVTDFSHIHHSCQDLHRTTPMAYDMPQMPKHTNSFHRSRQPLSALWYLVSICSRTSQDCCCNSASKFRRLSFNIAMISKLLRLIRTSSNSGISHSINTINVCTNLTTLVNLSNSISRPMSWSFTASYMALSLSLSLASIPGKTIAKFLDAQISRFQTGYCGFLNSSLQQFTNSSIPRQVVGVLQVQTPFLCLQD